MSEQKEKILKEALEQESRSRRAMLSMLEDIQEQKQLIERSNKEWFESMDSIEDAIMLHDKDNRIMRVNRAYKELANVQKFKDIIGKPYYEVFPKLDAPMYSCSSAIETKYETTEEFKLQDGRLFRSRGYPISDENGAYSYSIHIFEDITLERARIQNIENLNKTLFLIRKCNEILVRAKDKESLIKDICDEITKDDIYSYAALFLRDAKAIKCLYYSFETHDMQQIYDIDFSLQKYEQCPVVVSINSKEHIVISDIQSDEFWKNKLLQHKELCPAWPYEMKGSMLCQYMSFEELDGSFVVYSKEPNIFRSDTLMLFKELVDDVAYGIHHHKVENKLKETSLEQAKSLKLLNESFIGTIQALSKMTELRDPYTAGHQNRVAKLSVAIAKKLLLDEEKIQTIELAATVHDIGKIQIPTEILTKPTKLNDLEYKIIKTHPMAGHEILKDIKFINPIAKIVLEHHERLDGSGYPNALKGDEILLESKIISVADVVEAMASHRPYRASLGVEFALKEIKKYRGIWFEESIVDACVEIFEQDGYQLI